MNLSSHDNQLNLILYHVQPVLLAAAKFIAHLVNQQVAHEILALELLTVLLENPTDDSVEVSRSSMQLRCEDGVDLVSTLR